MGVEFRRLLTRNHSHHGAIDLGGRVEAARRHKQHIFHGVAPLQHDRQAAIGGIARIGHHAVDHLFLQHEVLVLHHIHLFQQMEQDGAGDVVGQVAHHTQLGHAQMRRQRPEVHLEHVGFDHIQIVAQAQTRRQVTVQLDHGELAQTLDQRLRQRHEAGTDLDHGLACRGVDGVNNAVDDGAVRQKVLAKTLAWNMFHECESGA